MWQPQSIVSLRATRSILEYSCIAPFQAVNRSKCIHYISIVLIFEIMCWGSFYFKYFYDGEIYVHLRNFDTVYFATRFLWFLLACIFGLGIILSLCSQSAQRQLIERMVTLDIHLESQLKINFSFRRLNTELVVYTVMFIIYNYGYYWYEVIYSHRSTISNKIYYFCCSTAALFFFVYTVYKHGALGSGFSQSICVHH